MQYYLHIFGQRQQTSKHMALAMLGLLTVKDNKLVSVRDTATQFDKVRRAAFTYTRRVMNVERVAGNKNARRLGFKLEYVPTRKKYVYINKRMNGYNGTFTIG